MLLFGAALSTCGSIEVTSAPRPIDISAAIANGAVAASSASARKKAFMFLLLPRPELERIRALVDARGIDDPLARGPQVDLMMQRDDSDVIDGDLGRLL